MQRLFIVCQSHQGWLYLDMKVTTVPPTFHTRRTLYSFLTNGKLRTKDIPEVELVFINYPDAVQNKMSTFRELTIETAEEIDETKNLERDAELS